MKSHIVGWISICTAVALWGCREVESSGEDAPPEDAPPEDVPPDEVVYPKACADIYDPDTMPTFELEMAPSEWTAMGKDCTNGIEQYRPAVFKYGTEAVDAMVRLKGNYSWNCEKMQFVVSFNETDSHGRFHGLRKIVLDAPWYDPTLLQERMAFDFLARYGVPYSCINNARLIINGTYYGVYANVERIDHEYLERHFAEHEGNLYKGGTELKTNEDTADYSDRDAFEAAQEAADIDALEAIVDLSQAVTVWAGEAMIPDRDSYWAGVEINYYIYNHPGRGFLFLPYDADMSFAVDATVDPITHEHSYWKREMAYKMALSGADWCEAFVDALAAARAAYDVGLMQEKLDKWSAQIDTAVKEDPNKTFSYDDHVAAVAEMHAYFQKRADFVDNWLAAGSHCPPTWPD